MKDFPHWEQLKGFSEEWICKWFLSWLFFVKLFPHWEQVKGFIPAWINMWFLRFVLHVKDFPHWEQLKGFSEEWICKWSLSCIFFVKLFPHWEQVKGFIPAWFNVILKAFFTCETLSTLRAAGRVYSCCLVIRKGQKWTKTWQWTHTWIAWRGQYGLSILQRELKLKYVFIWTLFTLLQ